MLADAGSVLFAGGIGRLVSMAVSGVPPLSVIALLALELALPPMLHLLLSRALRRACGRASQENRTASPPAE